MASSDAAAEWGLVGEPRARNGLSYYPGVAMSSGQVVVLSNVVRLQLSEKAGAPVGFGFLKGVWLWRSTPYIRVQYLEAATSQHIEDVYAVANGSPPGELMVTNRVGDLHLNALLSPVRVVESPLSKQLFQENVGPDVPAFSCTRHLDGQHVQVLDEAFRLTPIVQPFGRPMLRRAASMSRGAIAPAAPPAAAAATRPESLHPGQPQPSQPLDEEQPPGLPTPAQPQLPLPPPAAAPAAATPGRAGTPGRAQVQLAEPARSPRPPERPADLETGESAEQAEATPSHEWRYPSPYPLSDRPVSPGLGPSSGRGVDGLTLLTSRFGECLFVGSVSAHLADGGRFPAGAILLHATRRGAIFSSRATLRCPASLPELRDAVAELFELSEPSVRILFRAAPRQWLEPAATSDLHEALAAQPELNALPLHVTGKPLLHLPPLHICSVLLQLTNLLTTALFAAHVLGARAPPPYALFAALIPLAVLGLGLAASYSTLSAEYTASARMRRALARRDGHLPLLLLASLLGPGALLLACRTRLAALKVSLSRRAELALVLWASSLHLVHDMPTLMLNLLMHAKLQLRWELVPTLALYSNLASLLLNGMWHSRRLESIRREGGELGTRDGAADGVARSPVKLGWRAEFYSRRASTAAAPPSERRSPLIVTLSPSRSPESSPESRRRFPRRGEGR